MKKIRGLLIFLIMFFTCFFVSCQNEVENGKYQIVFNLMGGTYNDSEESVKLISENDEVITPITPVRVGYIFMGWSSKLGQNMISDIDFTKPINTSTVVYAIWSLPKITYELNGGFFTKYNSFDELVDDFIGDFATIRTWVDKEWFFDASWGCIDDFFKNDAFLEKWKPLLEYFKTVSTDNTFISQINIILNGKYTENEGLVKVRMNIHNFLNRQSQHNNSEYHYINTIDYSKEETINKVWGYFRKDAPSYYDSSTDYVLLTPYHVDKTFMGWYDNPECTGDKITVIPKGTTKELKYYALWA